VRFRSALLSLSLSREKGRHVTSRYGSVEPNGWRTPRTLDTLRISGECHRDHIRLHALHDRQLVLNSNIIHTRRLDGGLIVSPTDVSPSQDAKNHTIGIPGHRYITGRMNRMESGEHVSNMNVCEASIQHHFSLEYGWSGRCENRRAFTNGSASSSLSLGEYMWVQDKRTQCGEQHFCGPFAGESLQPSLSSIYRSRTAENGRESVSHCVDFVSPSHLGFHPHEDSSRWSSSTRGMSVESWLHTCHLQNLPIHLLASYSQVEPSERSKGDLDQRIAKHYFSLMD
jgi:hypothetical protein